MDDARFDGIVRRLRTSGSRRPAIGAGLAALAALGVSVAQPEAGDARKKKKKKKKGNTCATTPAPAPQCTSCPACQTCANGACQPIADGTACGSGGVCIHGGCATQCVEPLRNCPFANAACYWDGTDAPGYCYQQTSCLCGAPKCTSDAHCPIGWICNLALTDGPPDPGNPEFICVKVLGG